MKRVKYFTNEKKAMINPENKKKYNKYYNSRVASNRDVKSTTYKVYKNYMDHFLVYLMEEWDNVDLYSEEFLDSAVEIMEGFMIFCQDVLYNNKKVINTKISAVSSFYIWSVKRDLVDKHPFDNKLERMKGAQDEQIIDSHYLNEEETDVITKELETDKRYDIQDRLIWGIMLDSANRVGAISKLTLSSLNLDLMVFEGIREKLGKIVEVAFEEDTAEILREWLELRKDMDNLEVDAVFITKYNGEYRPMSKGTIQERVKKIGHIIGLTTFRSHSIRKTKINQIYVDTGDLASASEYANHSGLDVTKQSYTKPQTKAELREKIAEMKRKKQESKNKTSE